MESLELIPGSGGVFEVTVNGDRIHSKKESGQYPEVDSFIKEMEGKTFE
ncbi:Rdx family protein [Bacillus sp. RAR_GA_16]|nr:Rdx family protein [Bacillus sp. RAR_GA_16]